MNPHTPGPWKVTKNTTPGQFVTDTKIRDWREGVIAVLHCDADANGRLIAAAPDLLEALEKIAQLYEGEPNNVDLLGSCGRIARAAIAKATRA